MSDVRDRATQWARHRYLLIATIASAALIIQPVVYDAIDARWVGIPFIPAFLAWFWAFGEAERHPQRLCDRCIHGYVAGIEEDAQRRMWMLRAFHIASAHSRKITAFLIAMIVVSLLLPRWYSVPVKVVMFGGVLVLLAAGKVHYRYLRWCPWCRDDGEDDREDIPDPVEWEKVR